MCSDHDHARHAQRAVAARVKEALGSEEIDGDSMRVDVDGDEWQVHAVIRTLGPSRSAHPRLLRLIISEETSTPYVTDVVNIPAADASLAKKVFFTLANLDEDVPDADAVAALHCLEARLRTGHTPAIAIMLLLANMSASTLVLTPTGEVWVKGAPVPVMNGQMSALRDSVSQMIKQVRLVDRLVNGVITHAAFGSEESLVQRLLQRITPRVAEPAELI